jgi:2-oxoglutarate ferredoxin oxidoreductase subunit gamma
MHAEIAIAGSGGQGVLLIGRILAEAGVMEGREVAWLPSYGAEKRGGSVGCHVTISDKKIGALIVSHPDAAIAMNQVSAVKFEPAMKSSSLLIINQSLVPAKVNRVDIRVAYVPASHLAIELGSDAVANMVILGALVASYSIVSPSSILSTMDAMFGKNPKALEMNKIAFKKGLGTCGNN